MDFLFHINNCGVRLLHTKKVGCNFRGGSKNAHIKLKTMDNAVIKEHDLAKKHNIEPAAYEPYEKPFK